MKFFVNRSSKFSYMLKAITLACLLLTTMIGKANADVDAWPLLELEEGATTVLYPLHVREEDFEMNFPVYYKTNEGRDLHYFWPLIKVSDGKLSRVAPFYFANDEGDYTIFPIMTRRNGESWWLIPPMYLGKNTKAIFPFYLKTVDKDYYRKHVLLYYKVKTPKKQSSGLFPFYMRTKKTHFSEENDNIWQASHATKGTVSKKTNVLWPLFSKRETRDLDGNLLKRKRRFLFFQDDRDFYGDRQISFLGFIFKEKIKKGASVVQPSEGLVTPP